MYGPKRVRVANLDRLRNAVAGCQKLGKRTTVEGAMSLGLTLAARVLERTHNGGKRFDRRAGDLPPGRRPKRRKPAED